MWSVRDVKTHKVMATGFSSKEDAAKKAEELLEKDWRHYEAYPSRLCD